MTQRRLSRILLVDDDSDIGAITRLALESLGGYVVRTSRSGPEGVEAAQAFSPDLILLDVMMPGLDGPATLAALRADAQTAAIPVVFLTAKAQPREVARYRELGALDVITKPFDPMTLPRTLQEIWKRHEV